MTMNHITNTALVTYQYTTGPQSVTKSATAKAVAEYVKCRHIPLNLNAMTACAKYCQPFWFALAVENPFDCELTVLLKAHLGEAICLSSVGFDGNYHSADLSKGMTLLLAPCQKTTVYFCATLSKPPFWLPFFRKEQKLSATVSASYCKDETEVERFSNVVEMPLCC